MAIEEKRDHKSCLSFFFFTKKAFRRLGSSTDDFAAIHKMTTTWAAVEFRVDPVLDIQDAVAAQLEAMAWLDSIPSV